MKLCKNLVQSFNFIKMFLLFWPTAVKLSKGKKNNQQH